MDAKSKQPRLIIPYFTERSDFKVILDKAVEKAFHDLTGRYRLREQDERALEALGVQLVHVDKLVKHYAQ